jgi:hypothetical protein
MKHILITTAAVLLVGCGTTSHELVLGPEAKSDPVAESTAKTLSDGAQKETTKYTAIWYKWQRDIVHFNAMLQKLAETADTPEEGDFKKRIKSKSGWVELITDGGGGVVDFNAAQGTIQYEANKMIGSGGPHIDWKFELSGDTETSWNNQITFVPKIALIASEVKGKDEPQPRFVISIAETDVGPFKAGDRIRLRASIDDFSRFKKKYSKATGLVAIYYLEHLPNPVFDIRLDEAKVTLLEPSTGEQDE